MRVCTVVLPVSLLVLSTSSLYAQDSKPIQPGDRVRACYARSLRSGAQTLECSRHVGEFIWLTADTIRILVEDEATERAVPLDSITRLEASRGRRSLVVPVAAGGALAGGAFGMWMNEVAKGQGSESSLKPLLVSTVIGAGVGAVIGALIKTELWEEVPLDQLRVQTVATPDGRLGLTASLRF